MRRAALTVSGLSLSLLLALPGAVLAVGTLDQSQTDVSGSIHLSETTAARPIGQTFTAGISGELDTVELYPRQSSAGWLLQLRTVSGGLPTSTVLASQPITSTASFDWVATTFALPASVVAGTSYAIVVVPPGPGDVGFGSSHEGANPYPSGTAVFTLPDGTTWDKANLDLGFKTYVTGPDLQPDGRIRRGWGEWVGGNIYNTTGDGQSRQGDAEPGHWRSFRIQVQNDGDVPDRFTIDASGAAVDGYRVKFMKGDDEITFHVNHGTYQTRELDPGERATIEAWVKVQAGAAEGSSISRLMTLSSMTNPSIVDAVRFTVSRR